MHVTDRSKTVVMLIDWDNLQICHSRDAPGTELDLQALIALAQSYGTLVSARAYAEWNLLSERMAVYKAGIEPVFAPVMRPEGSLREGKSLADTVMVADGVDLLWTVAPDVFVLVTSDKDMIPLARIAKQRGAAVVVLGSDLTAIPLVEVSNVFITYRQLLRELDRVGELEAPAGRAPARERRLRETRRPSSEPYGGGLGGGSALGGGTALGGGRGTSRGVGTSGGPIGSSGRRGIAPPPTTDIQRGLTPPAATTPLPAEAGPEPRPEPRPEPIGIGVADVSPRRRRRRGGRGRRSGLAGEGEQTTGLEATEAGAAEGHEHDEAEDAPREGAEVRAAEARPSAPDDLDSAVLQILAARDRGPGQPAAEDVQTAPPPAAPAAEVSEPEPSRAPEPDRAPEPTRVPEPARVARPTPPARPRVARTSFSTFGPPDLSISPPSSSPASSAPAAESANQPAAALSPGSTVEQAETAPAAAEPVDARPDIPAAAAAYAAPAPSTTLDVAVPDVAAGEPLATPAEPGAAEPATAEAPTTDAPSEHGEAAAAEATSPARSGAARGRTRRSGQSRTRRASAESGAASPSVVESEESARPVRRRRTRRPAGASADAAGAAAGGGAGEGAGEGAGSSGGGSVAGNSAE